MTIKEGLSTDSEAPQSRPSCVILNQSFTPSTEGFILTTQHRQLKAVFLQVPDTSTVYSQTSSLLKSSWLKQLKVDWTSANRTLFKNTLHLPNLELSSSESVLGMWKGGIYRSLSVSIPLIKSAPWECVQEVLYHEMAHQYVDEVRGIRKEAPHGETFKKICVENGIDFSASGSVQSWLKKRKNGTGRNPENHQMIDKINKLLALAQSANVHEAERAMSKAQELLLKHNLSLLERDTQRHYIHKQIGEVGRRNLVKTIISAILSRFFFVEAIWTFGYDPLRDIKGRILEIYGTAENIEIATYVYEYLQNASEGLWKEYKEEQQINGNRNRRTFIYGLLNGFYKKLDGQVTKTDGKEMVWKGDPALTTFFRQRNPHIVRTSSRYSMSSKNAYHSGIKKGRKLVIHKGIQNKNPTHTPLTTNDHPRISLLVSEIDIPID